MEDSLQSVSLPQDFPTPGVEEIDIGGTVLTLQVCPSGAIMSITPKNSNG
jgi:hypothetical protein